MPLYVKKLHPNATIPTFATDGAAGFDLYACTTRIIASSSWTIISTGLAFEIPKGYYISIVPRSGLALKEGISVLNSPGIIDSDYRGEVKVLLYNYSQTGVIIEQGSRCAQGILRKTYALDIVEVEELSGTERGSGGFGSTGR